jgi:PPOX class probable F420-dependent enzyme
MTKRGIVPSDYEDLLESTALAHAATIGPDGEPQTQPVWFRWNGTHLLISHTKSRQKYRNLRREPRIALVIVDPNDPYRYIEVRGTVEIEDDHTGELIDRLSRRYKDKPWKHRPGEERVILKVTPTKVMGRKV